LDDSGESFGNGAVVGAREPVVLALAALTVVVGLFVTWSFLATIYVGPVVVDFVFRESGFEIGGVLALAGAGIDAGRAGDGAFDFWLCARLFDLVALGFVAAAHVVLGWIYLLASALFLPRVDAATKKNLLLRIKTT